MAKKKQQPFRGEGVSDAAFENEMGIQKNLDLAKEFVKEIERLNDEKKKGTTFDDFTNGNYAKRLSLLKQLKDFNENDVDLSKQGLKDAKKRGSNSKQFGDALKRQLPFVSDMNDTYKSIKKNYGFLGKFAGPLAAFAVLAKLALDTAKAVADTRKELGVSVGTSLKIVAANKSLGLQAKLYGLELEDIKSAQNTILSDLGGSVDQALKLSMNFARTSAATGQTSDELGKTLSIMEAISGASRDVLLNQIRANAAMIEAQGVAPGLVMKDIAANAEFFAEFAKDGGKNLIMAGTAARKLGLDMSAVADATNSLLEFESSIESSMEASLLLGRQINTDRARMLALTGDQEGLMKEIQRIAGSEQDFNQMNVLQRRALAKSVGQSVEGLARIVRNNQAGATGAAAGGAMGSVAEKQLDASKKMVEGIHQVADNTRPKSSY